MPLYRTDQVTPLDLDRGLYCQPTSLAVNDTIPAGYRCVLFGPLTIPEAVTLTIAGDGLLVITNYIMAK